jgi:hypothetical protein
VAPLLLDGYNPLIPVGNEESGAGGRRNGQRTREFGALAAGQSA